MLVALALVVLLGAIAYATLRRPVLIALASGPEYYARFATVGGLRAGDEVRYGGLRVGRVRAVAIDVADSSRIRVTFRVREDTPMRHDSRASVVDVSNPVTRYLDLRVLERRGSALAPGSEVASETGPTLEQTLTRVAVLLQRTDTLLDAASPLLQRGVFAGLARTTQRLDRMTAALVRSSKDWGPGVVRAAGRLDTVMTRTDRLLAALDSATPELRAASTEASGMLQDTRELVAQLRAGASAGGGVDALMRNLTTASNNLSRLADRLDRGPAALLRGERPIAKPAGPSTNE
jgi:phospholipid/cholesterol/gamma-HCH transport system substrate-binding protein